MPVADNGVSEAGLITAVQPVAIAAPNLRVIIANGKFQGVKIPQTPIGCLKVKILLVPLAEG